MFLVSHYRRERDSVFSSRPHCMDSMDCNSPAESDRAVEGESNPEIFWSVSGKRAVHKEAELCSPTPSTSVPSLLHCSRACAWTAAWEEQAEPQAWETAPRVLLWAKGKPGLGLWEGRLWAGKPHFIIPASFRKTQKSSFRAICC